MRDFARTNSGKIRETGPIIEVWKPHERHRATMASRLLPAATSVHRLGKRDGEREREREN